MSETMTGREDRADSKKIELWIRYFAAARDKVGCSDELLTFDHSVSLKELREFLVEKHVELASIVPFLRWAVNQCFVDDDQLSLINGDEIALIPPISGG